MELLKYEGEASKVGRSPYSCFDSSKPLMYRLKNSSLKFRLKKFGSLFLKVGTKSFISKRRKVFNEVVAPF